MQIAGAALGSSASVRAQTGAAARGLTLMKPSLSESMALNASSALIASARGGAEAQVRAVLFQPAAVDDRVGCPRLTCLQRGHRQMKRVIVLVLRLCLWVVVGLSRTHVLFREPAHRRP
jgi:hypothetical protein